MLFFNSASNGGQLVITCLCAGMLGGGALAFASVPMAAIAFITPLFIGSGLAIAQNNDRSYWLMAMLMVVYACILIRGVFVHASGQVNRLILQLKAERDSRTDPLTKLPNRVRFEQELERALARYTRDYEGFAVFYLDVDDFKAVNDKLGHAGGDELLVQMARRFRVAARAVDVVVRLSGDEFAIVAANVSDQQEASVIAERMMRALDATFMIGKHEFRNAVSIGVAIAPIDGTNPETLVRKADQALYRAKSQARGSACFASFADSNVLEESASNVPVAFRPRKSAA